MNPNQINKVGNIYSPNIPISNKPTRTDNKSNTTEKVEFGKIFESKLNSINNTEVKFSSHAKQRIDSRGIELNSNTIDKLNQAVEKAAEKGSKDSLILIKDLAFVVNIPNKVVVTAVDENSTKEHVFTKIDSAIII